MKIISSYSDFYDHIIHPTMMDESIRYVRETEIVENDFPLNMDVLRIGSPYYFRTRTKIPNYDLIAYRTAVLTIGRNAYRILVDDFSPDEKNFPSKIYGVKRLHPYGALNIKPLLNVNNHLLTTDVLGIDKYPQESYNYVAKSYRKSNTTPLGKIENFDATNICLHYQTPVVLIYVDDKRTHHRSNWNRTPCVNVVKNPPLTAFNIQHDLNPFEVWQDISMWIGGIMPGGCSPMVEISNENKITKAGFDLKISFRKRKQD